MLAARADSDPQAGAALPERLVNDLAAQTRTEHIVRLR
jgi:hypothetical protein